MTETTAITIGNFDGVHVGHQALLDRARAAVGTSGRVVVLVFHPHPATILRPSRAPMPVTTFSQRVRLLEEAGADRVLPLAATPALLALHPDAFLEAMIEQHRPSVMIEGTDFRFGRDRSGDLEHLRASGRRLGFDVIGIDPVEVVLTDHATVRASSTLVRWLLQHGRVRDCEVVLRRPHEMESTVVEGHKRGREIGFPTANVAANGCVLPADGVYAGRATLPDGSVRHAAISVGTNPTFNDGQRSCEAHLLDFDGPFDHYDWTIRLTFEHWLRDQIRYDAVGPLVDQLRRDIAQVRTLQFGERIHT